MTLRIINVFRVRWLSKFWRDGLFVDLDVTYTGLQQVAKATNYLEEGIHGGVLAGNMNSIQASPLRTIGLRGIITLRVHIWCWEEPKEIQRDDLPGDISVLPINVRFSGPNVLTKSSIATGGKGLDTYWRGGGRGGCRNQIEYASSRHGTLGYGSPWLTWRLLKWVEDKEEGLGN
ncbi:hypothetical protein H101_02588 [Trichophyton interdigitale H6]|nr:hypothetical protein H101_02588 [Trichophyton interdigitale H6]